MACGTPVIAFGRGGATETVVDGETGLFFEEQTIDSLCEAINEFERREKDFDPRRCRARAELFRRDEFQRQFREVVTDSGTPTTASVWLPLMPLRQGFELHGKLFGGGFPG